VCPGMWDWLCDSIAKRNGAGDSYSARIQVHEQSSRVGRVGSWFGAANRNAGKRCGSFQVFKTSDTTGAK
jgi:hypothetical protein